MLKVRVASAVVGLIMLVAVVWAGEIALGLAVFVLSIVALNEFYASFETAGYRPVKLVGYISCLPIVLIGLVQFYKNSALNVESMLSIHTFILTAFLIVVVLFSYTIFKFNKYNIVDISLTFIGIAYIVFMFSFVLLTRNLDSGFFYVWLIFIGAFATDTFAYFAGRYFGKRKILPVISPKKTVAGAIGGVFGSVLVMVLYGVFLNTNHYIDYIPLYHFAIIGLLCGCVSQIGDWAASSVKRFTKVKDYGNVMPGHGGVLDRFDSVLFTAPMVFFYLKFFIVN